ncbi:hypothetical protein NDU88_002744 [Pleurodeles waltl]|uniref:Uncharacterized protein n=1 Tax=Pleurodeles waltl TaxID=8319 RepID=A0AAV7VDC7_PLEWA|nr:hypothetical protein NDU88_002744 [Pleurodeles waltl]
MPFIRQPIGRCLCRQHLHTQPSAQHNRCAPSCLQCGNPALVALPSLSQPEASEQAVSRTSNGPACSPARMTTREVFTPGVSRVCRTLSAATTLNAARPTELFSSSLCVSAPPGLQPVTTSPSAPVK